MLSFKHLKDASYEDTIPFKSISYDILQEFNLEKNSNTDSLNIMIKMKPKNHFSSLHFSAKVVGEDDNSKDPGTYVYLGEQLTVAYF